MDSIKQGDTIPVAGAIEVLEDDVDVTGDINFSLWAATFAITQLRGSYEYAVDIEIEADGAFTHEVPSASTLTMPPGAVMRYDLRIKDESGAVVSSRTMEFIVNAAIAGVPV